ncbi:uncharacterized protein G2W53_004461 [Senna tora]|uniref:Uncharacterized protein n=1 Tax=Senna tora TaxID=362788 RepID=A0A834XCZ5_9FABA|nr:uncharacterized protein G2W53_004461 [Senna tora]
MGEVHAPHPPSESVLRGRGLVPYSER